MERQRSFSVKSTGLLILSFTVSSSLIFFAVFSFWIFRLTPRVRQEGHVHFNRSFAAVDPLTVKKLAGVDGNLGFGGNWSKDPTLLGAHFEERGNGSGSVEWAVLEQVEEDEVVEDDEQAVDDAKVGNFSAIQVNASGIHQQEKDNAVDANDTFSEELREVASSSVSQKEEAFTDERGTAEKEVGTCDLMNGRWVYDESYPLYTNLTCPFIDDGFNCNANGRQDKGYTKWRWQPHACEMPRFNATHMLETMRGKRLVFVGDSMNRNQWESLLCMLLGAVRNPSRVYETRGRKITKEKGNYCFKFVDYMCTVEFYVTHFLVHEGKARIGQKRAQTLRLDRIDHGSSRWRGADILVFNTAHWWSHYKTKSGINYYQERSVVHPRLDVSTAFKKALTTWASWVDRHINPRKTRVFFRSSSPSHFRGGQWNSGGHCGEATQPLHTLSSVGYPEKNAIVRDVIRQMKVPVEFLDITGLSEYRIDGHPSVYGRGKLRRRRSPIIEDCSHWCLPGVPDTWNELLYVRLLNSQHR